MKKKVQEYCDVTSSSGQGSDSVNHKGQKKGKKKKNQSKKNEPKKRKPKAPTKKKVNKKKNTEVNTVEPKRNLSRVYAMQPRWNALQRCSNWVSQLPSCRSSLTAISKSNVSKESDIPRFDSSDPHWWNKNRYSSFGNISDNKRNEFDKNSTSVDKPSKHWSGFDLDQLGKLRKKLKIIHSTLKRSKPVRNPLVSAKQKPNNARKAYHRIYQKNKEIYKQNKRKNHNSKEDSGKEADLNYFKRKVYKLKREFNRCKKNRLQLKQSRLYMLRKDTKSIGWMILRIVFRLRGRKSYPIYMFHLLRQKGFANLTFSTLHNTLYWLEKKGLVKSLIKTNKFYPKYLITSKGKQVLEKRMNQLQALPQGFKKLHIPSKFFKKTLSMPEKKLPISTKRN